MYGNAKENKKKKNKTKQKKNKQINLGLRSDDRRLHIVCFQIKFVWLSSRREYNHSDHHVLRFF